MLKTEAVSCQQAAESTTPVPALHLCAEFNSVDSARVLIENGADVNALALCDARGMGGQTPIFHAVNSILNYSRPVMELLVEAGADGPDPNTAATTRLTRRCSPRNHPGRRRSNAPRQ